MKKRIYFSLIALGLFACLGPQEEKADNTKSSHFEKVKIKDNTITNLYDAFGKNRDGLIKDFGFSALVKYKGKLILFDSGTDAAILKNNVEALGIDLSMVDFAVGSHAHGDHINGFDYLLSINPDVRIYLPSDFFIGAPIHFNVAGKEKNIQDSLPTEMRYFDGEKLDFDLVQSGRFWNANITYVKENLTIEPGIQLIFTRSPFLGYCSKYPSATEMKAMSNDHEQTDNNDIKYAGMPELSLSLNTSEGEVLLVGCSHSSVQNIVQETRRISDKQIALLAGGFHMLPYGREELNQVARQLKNEFYVKQIAPTHCTGHLAFKILKDHYGPNYLFAGLGERLEFKK